MLTAAPTSLCEVHGSLLGYPWRLQVRWPQKLEYRSPFTRFCFGQKFRMFPKQLSLRLFSLSGPMNQTIFVRWVSQHDQVGVVDGTRFREQKRFSLIVLGKRWRRSVAVDRNPILIWQLGQ